VIGRSADLLFAEDRTREMPGVVGEIRAGQHVRNFETVSRRKDGTAFPVRATISPVCKADGEVVGVSYIVRDVTS
jgi:PAS domain S-box-containing protein